ncbi:ribonuclease 2-like isoform X1 [Hevea brasiliensis]|uniref:ribonuclease 2-like isoform X1 n=1 Tax=Hevea brasiliensis TaxID=3981 RepID=UPI0025E47C1D|nr:ribonuclease 2-like isoform X1 [Hevea brasiliensis]
MDSSSSHAIVSKQNSTNNLSSMASLSVKSTIVHLQLALLLLLTASFCMIEEVRGKPGQRDFDYFMLALQWPGTYCQRTCHCCSSNACCRGSNAPTEFTIHGLWPDYNDGTWPACCRRLDFDEKEISTLLDGLQKYWPSLSCGSSSTCHGTKGSFWAHEKVLNEAGYIPSNTEKYPLGGIVSTIENAFHTTPSLICPRDAVEELRLCFYKDFKPRDCVVGSIVQDMYSSRSSCPKYVSLPLYFSSGLDVAETAIPWVPDNEAM